MQGRIGHGWVVRTTAAEYSGRAAAAALYVHAERDDNVEDGQSRAAGPTLSKRHCTCLSSQIRRRAAPRLFRLSAPDPAQLTVDVRARDIEWRPHGVYD